SDVCSSDLDGEAGKLGHAGVVGGPLGAGGVSPFEDVAAEALGRLHGTQRTAVWSPDHLLARDPLDGVRDGDRRDHGPGALRDGPGDGYENLRGRQAAGG